MEISQLFPDRIKEGNWASCTSCILYERSEEKKLNLKYIDTRISHKVPLVKKTKRGNIVGEFKPKREFIWRTTRPPPLSLPEFWSGLDTLRNHLFYISQDIQKERERERQALGERIDLQPALHQHFPQSQRVEEWFFRIQNLLKMFQNCGLREKQGSLTGPREMYSTTFSDWYEDEVSNAKSKISFSHFFFFF